MEETASSKRGGGGGLWHVLEMAKKHNRLTMRSLSGLWCRFNSLMVVIIVTFVVVFVSITKKNGDGSGGFWHEAAAVLPGTTEKAETCDLFEGKWVFDNSTYPLYSERRCKFMSDQSACEKFGRENLRYQNWRWKPHGCDLPRYNDCHLPL